MSDERSVAVDMLNNVSDFPADEIIYVLEEADKMYHNGDESFLDDNEYDALYVVAKQMDPSNKYFTGVGSDVRGGKVDLPFEMGSLNQVEIGDIEQWTRKHDLHDKNVVISDKMDGTSAMMIFDTDGQPQIAYSRGNGTQGADISRHIFKIKNVPMQTFGPMTVRAEVELTETAFKFLRDKVSRHSSKEPYKNARNMVAGLMNRKENPAIVYEHLTVVTYEVIGYEGSKSAQLELLKKNGFQVVKYAVTAGSNLSDQYLAGFLETRRAELDYEIDGLVIDVDSEKKRASMNPTRDTLNPEYSIKYKVADASNQALVTVKGVTWNLSRHGFWKPQVNLEPVELCGVTISNATGFNAKFISENGVGPGAVVRLTRSGDVIPFITDVIEKATPMMPEGDWEWNETGVDAVIMDKDDNAEVKIQRIMNFFASIEAPHLKEGTVRKFVNAGFDSTESIIKMTNGEMVDAIGENGNKVYAGLKDKLTNVAPHIIMGSVPFFGRGVGKRKFKKLIKALGLEIVYFAKKSDIAGVDGFEEKTAEKIVRGMDEYLEWLEGLEGGRITLEEEVVVVGGGLEGQKICMTGFRDKDMAAAIEAAGGEVQSGVSGKTTLLVCKDPNSNSGKVKKAKDKGIKVISVDEMKGML